MSTSIVFRYLLVACMFGIESCLTLGIIIMIANIQTLGVALRYASIPGIIGSSSSLLFIPAIGFFIERRGSSKIVKANVLIGSVSLQMTGMLVVCTANCLKLFLYEGDYDLARITAGTHSSTQMYALNNISVNNYSNRINSSVLSLEFFEPVNKDDVENSLYASGGVQVYAILAMIGYSLNSCGCAFSNCFMRTFVLASTPVEEHADVLVKALLVSSLGGCLVAILGSAGLGTILTAGTSRDVNAAQSAFLSALCAVMLIMGLTITLTTGFRYQFSWRKSIKEYVRENVSSGTKRVTSLSSSDVFRCLYLQRKHFVVYLSTFLLVASLCSYEVYFVNFIGERILGGDPQADTSSQQYKNYVKGVEIGSSGTLIFYISFTLFNSCQELLLRYTSWKMEILIACLGNIAVNIVCALTAELWCVYMMAVWSGFFKTVVYTVPYILACQIAVEQNPDKSSVGAISGVSSMLPSGFILCMVVVGPLVDVTGNVDTSFYFSTVTCLLGMVVISLLQLVK